MNLEFFIAKRIYFNDDRKKQAAKPAIRIATIGMALGLVIMIVALAVVMGFKREVRLKVIGFGSHIQLTNFRSGQSYETLPIEAGDTLLAGLERIEGVSHVQRYATKPGMIMTADQFQGMVLKGVGQEYDMTFLREHLLEGEVPSFTDTVASNQILVSRAMAAKLHLQLGESVYTYYIQENVRARKLKIVGIYETNFSDYDNLFVIGDLYTVNRLNKWEADQVSGVEIQIERYEELEDMAYEVYLYTDSLVDGHGNTYYTQTIEELNPQLFAWLDVLDLNVWVILILMLGVAGFSMISGLLIIILERTNMIGILKALGDTDRSIRKIFLYFSAFIVGKGMLWGNAIGLLLCWVQHQWHIVKLDPVNYYLDSVPVYLNVWVWLLLNVGTLIVSILILVGPSYLISHIHPARSIRFE